MILHMQCLDMWLGQKQRNTWYRLWWSNYEDLYAKVCADFNLQESIVF